MALEYTELRLLAAENAGKAPGVEVSIDVEAGVLSFGTRRAAFPLEPFARYCLRSGLDELAFLLSREREIAAYEAQAGPAPWRSS